MNTSSQQPRWSVIGILTLLALAAMLTGWLVKQQLSRTGPPPGSGSEAAVTSEAAERAAAPAALSREPLPRVRGAALAPTAGGLAGGGGVQRLEQPEQSPAWAVQYGQEFWRRGQRAVEEIQEADGSQAPAGPNLNLAEVMDRVSHAWMADGAGAEPQVRSRTYTATLGEEGVVFSPHRPAEEPVAAMKKQGDDKAAAVSGKRRPAPAVGQPDPDTAVRFATETVTRDGQALFAAGQGGRSWVVLGNTAQSLLNEGAGLVEHYEGRNEGVEVSWVLQQPVVGSGPLVVEAKAEGLNYAGQTGRGHHFMDANGVARVRVGIVEVADAAGQRWELAMRVEGDRLRVEVPEEVLAQAAYPVAIDPALEAEFGMDKPVVSPAWANQQSPAVAGGTSGFLVVWEDNRDSGTTGHDIYGTRVTSAGVVSDPNGLAVCTAASAQYSPAVAASGGGYLVVWGDYRSGSSWDIYGARVTSAGAVSDPSGIPICTAADHQSSPVVAAGGSGYLVVWEDYRNEGTTEYDIYGARVTSAGVVSDPNGLAICTAANNQYSPAVAASGTNYLVVWQDERNYERNSETTGYEIYGARVTSGGAISPANGLPVSTGPNGQQYPAVASNGTNYLVVWQDARNAATTDMDIYGARVTSAGAVSDPNGLAICTAADYQASPAVAASGTNYLVVWWDNRNYGTTGSDIYGARVTSAGVVSDPSGIPICTATRDQYWPAVAASGSGYLVVWEDLRDYYTTGYDIYGARVTTGGVVSDHNGFPICTAGYQGYQASPAVAASGSGYLVVWEDYRNSGTTGFDIYGARVSIGGTVSDHNGFPICTAANDQCDPSVAANGNDYLVVWYDSRNSGTTSDDIYGARVTSAGGLPDGNGFGICTAAGSERYPVLASDGTNYVVVWEDSSLGLCRRRISPAGALLDTTPLAINGSLLRDQAALAYGGGGKFLLVSQGTRKGANRTVGTLITAGRPQAGPVLAFPSAAFQVSETGRWATVTVTLTGNNPGMVGVNYATADGTALSGSDYTSVSGTLWFASGQTKQTFTVPIIDNTLVNSDKMVNLVLSTPSGGATLGQLHRAVLTIKNNDAGGQLRFGAATYSLKKSAGSVTVTVTRSGGLASGVSVAYTTGGGTAVAGAHYTTTANTLSFAVGETSRTFTVPILNYTAVEGPKTFYVTLYNPAGGATVGSPGVATVTIND